MDIAAHFRDLSSELRAVQNRIRRLIGDAHWPSDGAWKESVIRTVIRGYLPASLSVGSGFILTPDGPSSQIDILIFDDSAPVLFRDGDFVIVPADCVRAVIEIKTSLNKARLQDALNKLNLIALHLRKRCLQRRPFIGLFSFEATRVAVGDVLNILKAENGAFGNYPITALSFGDDQFYRYWEFLPRKTSGLPNESWHAYTVPGLSQGYFLHNIVEHLFPHVIERAEDLWYPIEGKEMQCVGQIKRKS